MCLGEGGRRRVKGREGEGKDGREWMEGGGGSGCVKEAKEWRGRKGGDEEEKACGWIKEGGECSMSEAFKKCFTMKYNDDSIEAHSCDCRFSK